MTNEQLEKMLEIYREALNEIGSRMCKTSGLRHQRGSGVPYCEVCLANEALDRVHAIRNKPSCQDCEHDDTPLGDCIPTNPLIWAMLHCKACCVNPERWQPPIPTYPYEPKSKDPLAEVFEEEGGNPT